MIQPTLTGALLTLIAAAFVYGCYLLQCVKYRDRQPKRKPRELTSEDICTALVRARKRYRAQVVD